MLPGEHASGPFFHQLLALASRSTIRLDRLLQLILGKALTVTASDAGGSLFLVETVGRGPVLVASCLRGTLAESPANLLKRWKENPRSPAAIVLHSGQPYCIEDHRHDPAHFPLLASSRSSLWVPLLEGKRVIGVLHVESSRPGHYSDKHLRQLEGLAAEAIPAIHRLLLREWMAQAGAPLDMVGVSPTFLDLERQIKLVAASASRSVLVTGERGSGKELAARAIHFWSDRRNKPFVPVLVSGLTESLVAAELFGHEKYAFTDAKQARKGKFLAAEGGTLFLDEVGDLSPAVQAALLRVIQWGEIQPLGRDLPATVDVRVVAATNQHLPNLIAQGRFRQDLYDRLRVLEIRVPPLRERREDIPLLAGHFLRKYCHALRREVMGEGLCAACRQAEAVGCATVEFYQALQRYDWPGNVRELENLIIHLLTFVPEEILDVKHLPEEILKGSNRADEGIARAAEDLTLDGMTKRHIERLLALTGNNQTQAAKILRVPLSTLRHKMKKLGIKAPRDKSSSP